MRSCFVPNCDSLCKNMTKRMMFIPPKNQEMFNVWKSVLPNRRELKPTDRICERHFHTDDICKTFDHIINGVLHQIDRGKPRLSATAVPSYNLPADDSEFKRKHESSEPNRKTKRQREIVNDTPKTSALSDEATKTRRPIIKRLLKDFSNKQIQENASVENSYDGITETIQEERLLDDVNSSTDDHLEEQSNVVIQETTYELQDDTEESAAYLLKNKERSAQQTNEIEYECVDVNQFDGIYEDIYEVMLPNTLWAIHRDPNRNFIVFSYFDEKTCSMSKLIHLDSFMNTRIHVKGKMVNKYLTNLSIEYLTNLVNQVDEYQICQKFESNSKCEVVAVERSLCTVCQTL